MEPLEALFLLFAHMPRKGPGSDALTRRALRAVPSLPEDATILDLGCGNGPHTLVLADDLHRPVVGVDFHEPFLEQLRTAALTSGLDGLVSTRRADVFALEQPPASVDLIWSEGVVYIAGFEVGLHLWRPLLRPGGHLVVSDCVWLQDDPPVEARDYWAKGYPSMTTLKNSAALACAAGFRVLESFANPAADWGPQYIDHLEQEVAGLAAQAAEDASLAAVLEESRQEIDIARRFGNSFGYGYFVLQSAP